MKNLFLYPLSWIYGFVVYLRNQMYDLGIFRSTEFEVPVISVGNITVGGTGKTPQVEYLVNLLHDKYEVATLSRGYKRKTKGFRIVETISTVAEVGDEPLQIKNRYPNITVAVGEKRVQGVERLLDPENKSIPDVVILDDAFQHRKITAGINMLLIDYNRQLKDDALLPVGRLREGVAQMRRANVIVFTKCPNEVTPIMRRILQKDVRLKPYQNLFFTTLDHGNIEPVFSAPKLNSSFYTEKATAILVVTGIASPKLVYAHLKQFAKKIEIRSFSDHHYFTDAEINAILQKFDALESDKKIIVTTEKDSMRIKDMANLPEEFKSNLYYLPVKVKFLDDGENEFNKKILNYVGENKSNRELYQRKNKR
ncbi:tetraacyldisaccharide 4'-kinase [Draconibacterium sp.]|jgi:tetraacyldisaccharide 4'-kinase